MVSQSFNYHTHTVRCGHAEGEDEQYIRAAIMAGFKELGFSEHIPYPGIEKPGERMLNKDVAAYLKRFEELKQLYETQIKLKVGFEIEYFDDQLVYLQEMRKQCDYMILGQHCEFVDGGGYDYFSDDTAVKAYTKQVCAGMRSGLVSMVAHPDYFMLGRRSFSSACADAAHAIGACAVECGVLLEINLNGMRYGKLLYEEGDFYAYPYRSFWEIIAQYPVQVVYGFDAHKPTTLLETRRIEEAKAILAGISLTTANEFKIK